MLRKADPEARRDACESMWQLCWKGTKRGAGAVFFGWVFYVLFLVLSTHPCWRSSDCWAALFIGNNAQNFVETETFRPSDNPSSSYPNTTSLDHIVFGIAASSEKWKARKQYVDLWWRPGKTRGYVWLERPTLDPWPPESESPPFRISQDTSRFKFTHPNAARSAIRISRIVSETFRLGLPDVRWFVMGDDDTVFFTDNLVKVLSKYDHNQFYYIGSNSECVEQNMVHSYSMAYGGAGFALSYPLAKALAGVQDECLNRYSGLYGSDQRVHACLAELGVPLTKEPGFHQVDVHGSLLGILAAHPATTPLVSLHHLDAVAPLFPGMSRASALRHLMIGFRADPDRIVQQNICYDKARKWTVSISWGYTIHIYRGVHLPRALEYPLETFVTWKNSNRLPFVFNTRPVAKDPCQNPSVLFMERVENYGHGRHVSSYIRHGELGPARCNSTKNNPDDLKRVGVIAPKMNADWTLAPRKQCCDVVSSAFSGMEVYIRSCRAGESVSPP